MKALSKMLHLTLLPYEHELLEEDDMVRGADVLVHPNVP
jgi:hypothetical protein